MTTDMKRSGFSRKLLGAVLSLAIVGGTGAGSYWLYAARSSSAPIALPETGIVPLDSYVVNLADPGGTNFLRLSVSLVVADAKRAQLLSDDSVTLTRVRSQIFKLLAQQTAQRLDMAEGRKLLKTSIAKRAGEAASGIKVVDVLFSEFVVQGPARK